MATLVRSYDQIAAVGGRVVAIMPERQEFAAAFKRDTGAPFPILTDIDNAYALACNLMIWVGDELRERMQEIGRDLTRYQGTGAWTLPIPAVFIIGRDGRVKARFVDPDYRRRMQIDDIVAALADAAAG